MRYKMKDSVLYYPYKFHIFQHKITVDKKNSVDKIKQMTNKQLKKTLDNLNIKIFDMLRFLDPSDTGKYMKFLVKEFRKRHKELGYTNYSPVFNEDNYLDSIRKKCKNELEDRVVEYLIDIMSTNNITNLQVFHDLLERNKIKERDMISSRRRSS